VHGNGKPNVFALILLIFFFLSLLGNRTAGQGQNSGYDSYREGIDVIFQAQG